ncbi:MAG TPA: PspC domain-containing protein, partial [Candidatus Dorea faecipullorum]|nr:PspC domain-containing protein [Candidatus Dorea faecipullorum]
MESKRLYRSRRERLVCGVCGGVAEYFNIDPTIVRLAFLLFVFCAG